MKPTLHHIDDCWNRIGVSGDQSCPELARVVHCRNCEVYANAARHNLQRVVDDSYRAEWAAHFSRPDSVVQAATEAVLVFRLGREWLAVSTASVDTVAPLAPGHRLPHRSSPALLGIVSVAGTLTPLIALDAMLAVDASEQSDASAAAGRHVFARLLVLRADGQRFAMRVAELHGIVRFSPTELSAPPATVNKGAARFLRGVLALGADDPRRVGVLDGALLAQALTETLR